jgi:hypothetical protein
MANNTTEETVQHALNTVDRINREAGITGNVPPAFQYRPIDIGVEIEDPADETRKFTEQRAAPDTTTEELVNGKYVPTTTASVVSQGNNPDTWDMEVWGDALKSGSKYIKIEDTETRVLKFMTNDPVVCINKFKRKAWDFDVMDEAGEQKTFSVTNVSLMKVLYGLLPILYRNVAITRNGIGSATKYSVAVVRNETF